MPSQQTYDPAVQLSIEDLVINSTSTLSVVKLTIKQSNTDPFRKGVDLYLGKKEADIFPVLAILPYQTVRGPLPGALFVLADG